MTEIKLTKRYPQSRTEDIVDAYMRGWNDALDAVQNGKFHIADRKTENSSEIPNNCETCKHHDKYGCEYPCDECEGCDKWEQTEPTISKMEQVETMSCQECKHFHENAVMYLDQCDFCFQVCKYEPKDEPQTDCAWR